MMCPSLFMCSDLLLINDMGGQTCTNVFGQAQIFAHDIRQQLMHLFLLVLGILGAPNWWKPAA